MVTRFLVGVKYGGLQHLDPGVPDTMMRVVGHRCSSEWEADLESVFTFVFAWLLTVEGKGGVHGDCLRCQRREHVV